MKKSMCCFLAAGLLLCSLTNVYAGGQGDAAAKGPAALKLGSSMADGTVEVVSAKQFAQLLGEFSNGTIKCDVLAGGLAGGEREIVEGQQLGTIDMSVVSGILQNFDPAMMIMEYDLLFVNEDHVKKVFYGPVGQKIFDRLLQKTQIRILSTFMRTPRLMTTTRPINSVDDLKNLRLRVPEMKARTALWAALGASPTPMAFPEVYTALQTKTIDGQENPITAIVSSKFYEVCDYLALTNHVYGFMFLNIADPKYQSFSEEQKGWINKAAVEAAAYNDRLVKDQEKKEMDISMSRMTVTRPDTSSWRDATKDVYKQFLDVEGFQELYTAIVEAGKEFEKN
jgi:tripartite ATP-independent transporter DctP family solute receptor